MPLKGRVAWVTGAGRGIGRAVAVALAREGVHVALSARTKSELEAVAKELAPTKVTTFVAPCDVTDAKAVRAAYDAATKALGAPTILVNGAGIARSAAFLKTDLALMETHWRVNVLGPFHAMQAAIPSMLAGGWGRVVNIASIAGKAGAPYISSYAASKHALLGITRSLAQEYAAKGITVNAVCPGYVDTPMTTENVDLMAKKTGRPREELMETLRRFSPQNRLMTADEVASMTVHLCRDESVGINGQAVTIDGGAVQW